MAETRSAFDDMPGAASALWEAVKSAFSGPSAGEQIVANQEGKNDLIRQKKYAEAAKLGLIDDPITGAFAGSTIGKVGPGIIRAYHGSPHDFDKFSLSKIGTGEGAQAYGHGLYFAENPNIAEFYKNVVSQRHGKVSWDGKPLESSRDWYAAIDAIPDESWRLRNLLDRYGKNPGAIDDAIREWRDWHRNDPAMINAIDEFAKRANIDVPKGHMYEVQINAPESAFLDWDRPITKQPETVRKGLDQLYGEIGWEKPTKGLLVGEERPYFDRVQSVFDKAGLSALKGEWAFNGTLDMNAVRKTLSANPEALAKFDAILADHAKTIEPSGQEFYRHLSQNWYDRVGGDEKAVSASNMLSDAGIPGIKYLDAGSRARAAENGSRNYVVFDDSLIDILRKYGLAGLTTAGAAAAAFDLHPEEGSGMADGGSLSDIGFSTLAPGLTPAERDALVDPLTGMPRTRNLGEILTGNAAPEVPGYTRGSQLSKWFPGGTSVDAWRPSVTSALSQPLAVDPTIIVPSTAQEILGDIGGGGGGGGGRGGLGSSDTGNGNSQVESPSLGEFAKSAMMGMSAITGVPGMMALGLNIAQNQNKSMLERAMEALGIGAINDVSLNNDMGREASRSGVSGIGPSTSDVNAALNAYADRVGAFDTAPNAPNAPSPDVSALDGGGFNGPGSDAESGGGYAGPGGGTGGDFAANGGMIGYAGGGELPSGSYVVPADVVGAFGNGSTIAGARHLGMALGGRLVDGPGDGRSDDIPFRGPGGRQINLSNGEVVIPPAGVDAAGGPDRLDNVVIQKRKKQRRAMSAFGRPAR